MPWLYDHFFDDRQKLIYPGKIDQASLDEDLELKSAVQRAREVTQSKHISPRLLLLVILAGIGVVVLVVVIGITGVDPAWFMVIPAAAVLAVAVYAPKAFRDADTDKNRRLIESLLFIGRCPCCGYALNDQPTQPDDTKVCPECGAAWKSHRVGTSRISLTDPGLLQAHKSQGSIERHLIWQWTRGGSTTDDRNRAVPVTDLSLPNLDPSFPAAKAERVRQLVWDGTRGERYGCAIVIALLVLPSVITAVMMIARSGNLQSALPSALQVFWFVFAAILIIRTIRGRTPWVTKAIKGALLAQSICPSCTTNLQDDSREPDGCVLCSKCAAAWKVPDGPPANPAPRQGSL